MRAYHTLLYLLYCNLSGCTMEKLSQEQQESLRKASNERLRVMAGRLGSVDEEQVMSMDRPTLLQLIAKGMVAKADAERAQRQVPQPVVCPGKWSNPER